MAPGRCRATCITDVRGNLTLPPQRGKGGISSMSMIRAGDRSLTRIFFMEKWSIVLSWLYYGTIKSRAGMSELLSIAIYPDGMLFGDDLVDMISPSDVVVDARSGIGPVSLAAAPLCQRVICG